MTKSHMVTRCEECPVCVFATGQPALCGHPEAPDLELPDDGSCKPPVECPLRVEPLWIELTWNERLGGA